MQRCTHINYFIPLKHDDPFAPRSVVSGDDSQHYESDATIKVLSKCYEMVKPLTSKWGSNCWKSASAIRDYLWGSDPVKEGNVWKRHCFESPASFARGTKALQFSIAVAKARGQHRKAETILQDACNAWWMNEKSKFKTESKAAGVLGGLVTLMTVLPKFVHMIEEGCSVNEVREAFIQLGGRDVWDALMQVGQEKLRECLLASMPCVLRKTLVATLAIEGLVAVFFFMGGDIKAKTVLDKISSSVVITCNSVVYNLDTIIDTLKRMTKFLAVGVWVAKFLMRVADFVHKVCKFLTVKVGIGMTSLGTSLLLASQTGNAVMLLGILGAQASTGAAIGSLSGAAATNAGLAWLGGGTLASGGGGMAAGATVLSLASGLGLVMGAIGLGILVANAFKPSEPDNVDQVAKQELGVYAYKDEEPKMEDLEDFRRKLSTMSFPAFVVYSLSWCTGSLFLFQWVCLPPS